MKRSPSIDLIWKLAANEMVAGEFGEIQPEHFYMALLKFAEVSVKEPAEAGEQEELAKVIAEDVQAVREAVQKLGIESTIARRKLRKQLGKGAVPFKGGMAHRSAASKVLFESAVGIAAEANNNILTPLHLLRVLAQTFVPDSATILGPHPLPSAPAALPLLEKHARDLARQAAEGKISATKGIETQSKAIIRDLQHKDRKSVLLITDNTNLVADLAAALAVAIASKDAPDALKGKRLMDVSAGTCLEQLRQLLDEAASHPEVILLVPPMKADFSHAEWPDLLQKALKGNVQFICQTTPLTFKESLQKDAVWKRKTRVVWLENISQTSVPREL